MPAWCEYVHHQRVFQRSRLMVDASPYDEAVASARGKCFAVHRDRKLPTHHIDNLSPMNSMGAPFLLYPQHSNMRSMIDRFLDNLGLKRRVIMEASDTEAIKGLVESGFGYSILPQYALKGSKRSLQIMRVAGHRLVRSQALATSIVARPRALTESVATFLKEALADAT